MAIAAVDRTCEWIGRGRHVRALVAIESVLADSEAAPDRSQRFTGDNERGLDGRTLAMGTDATRSRHCPSKCPSKTRRIARLKTSNTGELQRKLNSLGVERQVRNQQVAGSIPAGGSRNHPEIKSY